MGSFTDFTSGLVRIMVFSSIHGLRDTSVPEVSLQEHQVTVKSHQQSQETISDQQELFANDPSLRNVTLETGHCVA